MKIILLKDVPKLGKIGEVKIVSDGYARNFLIARVLAEPATDTALKNLAMKQAEIISRRAREKAAFAKLAEKLPSATLRFPLKIGEKGQAFGSVTPHDIVTELGKKDIKIEKQWIAGEHGIKTAGEHRVKIKLPYQFETEVKIIVETEVTKASRP